MDSGAVSAGVFTLRDKAYINAMPVHNASGFWQAWKMPDGLFMVQPLEQDHVPWGTMYLLEPQEFSHLLSPFDPRGGAAEPGRGADRVDGPDFLAVWYEQALVEQGKIEQSEQTGGSARGEPQASWLSATPAKAPVSSDETVLMPLWHPDDIFADEGDSALGISLAPERNAPGAAGSARPGNSPHQSARVAGSSPSRGNSRAGMSPAAPGKAAPAPDDDLFSDIVTPEALSGPRPLDFLPPLSLEDTPEPRRAETAAAVPPKTAPQTASRPYGPGVTVEPMEGGASGGSTEFRDDDAYAQERAARLERSMRDEFSSLMKLLEKGLSPELERAFSRLIQRGTGFTSQQKFMFSEFGLALRRQHMQKLALACHLRALKLAPSDEHVLFNVARSKYELGDIDSARKCLIRALATAPDFTAARNFLSFLEGSAKSGY